MNWLHEHSLLNVLPFTVTSGIFCISLCHFRLLTGFELLKFLYKLKERWCSKTFFLTIMKSSSFYCFVLLNILLSYIYFKCTNQPSKTFLNDIEDGQNSYALKNAQKTNSLITKKEKTNFRMAASCSANSLSMRAACSCFFFSSVSILLSSSDFGFKYAYHELP